MMSASGWRHRASVILLLGFVLGCAVPSSSADPPLTAATAQHTLDSWNSAYCKVAEFYGFYQGAEGGGKSQVAYVLLNNPSDKAAKPVVFTARFQLLTLPDGHSRWFLTSLISHSTGLSRRYGWDNLIIPLKDAAPAPSK